MSNLLSLKHRISAAKNVSKTTKALQMISASKMKKAQDAVLSARPYVSKINEISAMLRSKNYEKYTHPYLNKKPTGTTLLIVLSPDKGLCGGLITNLTREFLNFIKNETNISYVVIGKKLESKIIKLSREIIATFPFGNTSPQFSMIYPIIKIIDKHYLNGNVDSVKILTTEFNNVFTQKPKIVNILPIEGITNEMNTNNNQFTIYEPDKKKILDKLLKHYLEMIIYLQLIESFVSEQASRMMAMQNATDNAKDIIEFLQLDYNKTRQAKITSDLLDIATSNNKSDSII